MPYGFFDDEQREYVITDPRTPVKWINYIGTLAFGGFVDHTGGALLCKGDPALNRLTKYIPQMPASDFKGTTLYLRIKRAKGYRIFSPFFVPTLDPYDRFECHVGLGYSRLVTEFYGLRTEATIFVPAGENLEIRDIRITNLGRQLLEVDAVPVVEYTHPDALKQLTNADWVPQTMQSRLAEDAQGLKTLIQYPFMLRDERVNYFTSNRPASSFETDRAAFLGDHEYGTWADPLSLHHAELGSTEALRGDNIAALLQPLGRLAPGESARLITLFGQEASFAAARPLIERWRSPQAVDQALHRLADFWDRYLGTLQVETPDPAMNSMLNIHNPRQCHTTLNWSRYLSLYQLGLGASRGIGFRDSSQDLLSVMATEPGEARELMRKLLSVQLRSGAAMHQFNPLTMEASVGDSAERPDRPHYYSDDHLWIVLAVTSYLKETGDFTLLDEHLPFYEKDPKGSPLESGTVLEHLRRALAFTRTNVGKNGLPLLGFADWNDTVNLPAGAESVFTAELYGVALREMIDLVGYREDGSAQRAYSADYDEMAGRVNQYAWDGEWYVRYFDADGSPLGSKVNAEGRIYINSQSWSVISGFAPLGRAEQAMQAVRAHLATGKGLKLSAPGFNGFDPAKGGVTTYPPGAKENGGIFLHTNPWVMIAEALLGRGDQAYRYYAEINPAAKNEIIDEFEVEPYVYPQNILGDEHPQFGLGRNSWLSGTAAWSYRAATQYILGIRPTYQGLELAPVIPSNWEGFRAVRKFRGATYAIAVRKTPQLARGVQEIAVDGKPIHGQVVQPFQDGTHQVEVALGR